MLFYLGKRVYIKDNSLEKIDNFMNAVIIITPIIT